MPTPANPDGTSQTSQWTHASHIYVAGTAVVACFVALAMRQTNIPVPDAIAAGQNALILSTGINPNTASAAELTTLPGIGPTKANRIVAYRESVRGTWDSHVPAFKNAEDLSRIKGIGPKTVERLRPWLRFGD